MKVNLYINYYVDKNPQRQEELNRCLVDNFRNEQIDNIYIIFDNVHLENLKQVIKKTIESHVSDTPHLLMNKIRLVNCKIRPTFNDYFKVTGFYSDDDDISIIANTDIIIPEDTVTKLKQWHWNGNYCMALCRYDIINGATMGTEFFNRPDAQDTWVVKGKFKTHEKANFTLGVAGCDNVIAYCLSDYYQVINPSIDIKTYHLHLTNVRNYIGEHNQIERLEPPYLVIHPTTLPL